MKKKETKEIQVNEKQSFFSFPQRANNLTILFILLVYLIVGGVVAFLISPNVNYTVVPSYKHELGDDTVSTYLRITSSVNKETSGFNTKESITIYLDRNVNDTNEYVVNYEFSGLTKKDNIDYMYTGARSNYVTLPMTHTVKSQVSIKDGGFKAIFGKIKYHIKDTEDSDKEYKFKEELITLNKSEIKRIKNTDRDFDGLFRFTKTLIEKMGEDYSSLSLNVQIETEDKYHLDFQSFIVSSDGSIYPVIGFYGYYSVRKNVLTGFTTISSNLDIKYFIVKANFYDANGKLRRFSYIEEIE